MSSLVVSGFDLAPDKVIVFSALRLLPNKAPVSAADAPIIPTKKTCQGEALSEVTEESGTSRN
jgi:hypothetical protein